MCRNRAATVRCPFARRSAARISRLSIELRTSSSGRLPTSESDGGPPFAARYITKQSHPYRLPSMELEYLIYEYDAFRSYLLGALDPTSPRPDIAP